MLLKLLRALAILCAVALFILTIVPADERPVTGIQHDIEHFGAYLLPGFLFGCAFLTRTWVLLLGSVAFTLSIELVQIPLPTRHARLEDFVVDCAGMCAGVLIGRLAGSLWAKLTSSRATPPAVEIDTPTT